MIWLCPGIHDTGLGIPTIERLTLVDRPRARRLGEIEFVLVVGRVEFTQASHAPSVAVVVEPGMCTDGQEDPERDVVWKQRERDRV